MLKRVNCMKESLVIPQHGRATAMLFSAEAYDQAERERVNGANKRYIRRFLTLTALALILNVAAGIFTAVYWPTGT